MPARRQSADDACPGALRLHAAADGSLARVRLPGGMLTGVQLGVLADLATRWGDGALELTSRANIQLRAVRASPDKLATRLAAAGLLPSPTHETVRNIVAPPLADTRTRALVEELDRGLCAEPELVALPGRFLFAIGWTSLTADAAAVPDGRGWAIVLGGTDVGVRVGTDRVVPTLLAAAHGFLAEQAGLEPRPWRLREIPDGPALVAARLAAGRPPMATVAASGNPAGPQPGSAYPGGTQPASAGAADAPAGDVHAGGARPDSGALVGILGRPGAPEVAVGALVPLRRLTRVPQAVLARAERLAVTSSGGIVVPDLTPEAADRWLRALRDAGLATEPDSKWVGVTAFAGRPGCGKALADVRADAEKAARFVAGPRRRDSGRGVLPVHWVGCERGCGSPAGEHVRVEATRDGYRVAGEPVASGDLGEVVAARRV